MITISAWLCRCDWNLSKPYPKQVLVELLGFTLSLYMTVLWQSRICMGIDNPLLLTVQPNLQLTCAYPKG